MTMAAKKRFVLLSFFPLGEKNLGSRVLKINTTVSFFPFSTVRGKVK